MSISDPGVILGIGLGLSAAFFQSLSYVCSRLFIARHNNDIMKLLALSHILMGIVSVPLALFFLPETMPKLSVYLFSLLATVVFYLLGQVFLFAAIIQFEPSRVSPLLGIKILMLATISVVFSNHRLTGSQWIAVLLCTISVFLLSHSGKRIEWKCIVFVLLACFFYSLSDLGITSLVGKFSFLGTIHGALFSSSLCYILCGVFGLFILLLTPQNTSKDTWIYAIPFAVSWFVAMILLFSCFGTIGVVFGNIMQSARGIISILLGVLVAYAGFEALEPKGSKQLFIQRILAAILMTASVALFLR